MIIMNMLLLLIICVLMVITIVNYALLAQIQIIQQRNINLYRITKKLHEEITMNITDYVIATQDLQYEIDAMSDDIMPEILNQPKPMTADEIKAAFLSVASKKQNRENDDE